MYLPFELLEKIADVVETQARTKSSKISGVDAETFTIRVYSLRIESSTQNIIHRGLEGGSTSPHLGFQLFSNVVIQGKGCSHVLML